MSQSPFDRHGQAALDYPRYQRLRLYGGRYETPFAIAARVTGEWRMWRDVVKAAGVADAFDLMARQHDSQADIKYVEEPLGIEPLKVLSASPDLVGDFELVVEDISETAWDISLKIADAEPGEPFRLLSTRLEDARGPIRAVLYDHGERYWVEIEFDIDMWLVMWLTRELALHIEAPHTNYEVEVPLLTLGDGR